MKLIKTILILLIMFMVMPLAILFFVIFLSAFLGASLVVIYGEALHGLSDK